MSLPNLSEVLAYDNTSVVKQFCLEHSGYSTVQAEQIFKDLLAWLWLSVHRKQRQLITHMIQPLLKLDHMWHVFILHTKDYTQFCHHYFQEYLHHIAEEPGNEYSPQTEELSLYLGDCYDYLGEAWLMRYFFV